MHLVESPGPRAGARVEGLGTLGFHDSRAWPFLRGELLAHVRRVVRYMHCTYSTNFTYDAWMYKLGFILWSMDTYVDTNALTQTHSEFIRRHVDTYRHSTYMHT